MHTTKRSNAQLQQTQKLTFRKEGCYEPFMIVLYLTQFEAQPLQAHVALKLNKEGKLQIRTSDTRSHSVVRKRKLIKQERNAKIKERNEKIKE